MPLLDAILLLRGQLEEHLAGVPPELRVQRAAAALWDKHHVMPAVPHRVIQTLTRVDRNAPFRVLGGSRRQWPRWTLPDPSDFYCLPRKAGPAFCV